MDTTETILCRDCGIPFPFSVSEQRFFRSQGWGRPCRCRDCRERKKARREKEERYYGLHEVMKNSHSMRRDTKGTVVNRSGSSWERIEISMLPGGTFFDSLPTEEAVWMGDEGCAGW